MSSESRSTAENPGHDGTPSPPDTSAVEWTVDPWRERARNAAAALAGATGSLGLAWGAGLPPLTTAVLAVAAGVVLAPGYLASHCRVDAHGVARKLGPLTWERRAWLRVRSTRLGSRALVVEVGPGKGLLASLRGLHLPLPSTGHEPLRARLRELLADHGH